MTLTAPLLYYFNRDILLTNLHGHVISQPISLESDLCNTGLLLSCDYERRLTISVRNLTCR